MQNVPYWYTGILEHEYVVRVAAKQQLSKRYHGLGHYLFAL